MKKTISYPVENGILILFFVLFILTVVFNLYEYVRNNLINKLGIAPKKHDSRVKQVQQQVRKWKDSGCEAPMCTGRPRWHSQVLRIPKYKNSSFKVDISLSDILEVNTEERFVRVEPLVTMHQLTETLCPMGWVIPVVAEIEDVTVGGLINGAGMETSSHIYGMFHNTCLAYELVMSDGSLVRCTEDENTDLFHAVPWSHGTLGFVVAAEIRIIPCTRYIKMEYIPFYTMNDVVDKMLFECKKPNPHLFVEGYLFTKDTGVIILGQMTEHVEEDKINNISRYYKPAFYKHVEAFLRNSQRGVDYVPTRNYYYRHSRNIFWLMDIFIPYCNQPMFRYFLGWLLPIKSKVLKLFETDLKKEMLEKNFLISDLSVPAHRLKQLVEILDDNVNIYPLWLCGVRLFKTPGLVYSKCEDDLYVDIALLGYPQVDDYEPVKTVRKLQSFLHENKGFKALYNNTYMTEEEFRTMYDHTLYDQVRTKNSCLKAFPSIFQKVCKSIKT